MPFITPTDREKVKRYLQGENELSLTVGDLCYIKYKEMIQEWKKSRRWTTAHNIYKEMRQKLPCIIDEDEAIAYDLAWQVFFQKEVMKYEDEKELQNGKIEG